MKTRTRITTSLAALAVVLAAMAPALAAEETVPGLPAMVGLGDSWTYGQGAADPAVGGYFARTNGMLREDLDCVPAASENAVDGASICTATTSPDPPCPACLE